RGLTARRRKAVELVAHLAEGGVPALDRGVEDHLLAVRAPDRRQRDAGLALAAGEARRVGEPGRRQYVLGLRAGLQRHHLDGRLALVQPLVPVADREVLIGAHVVFARLLGGRGLAVGLVVQ